MLEGHGTKLNGVSPLLPDHTIKCDIGVMQSLLLEVLSPRPLGGLLITASRARLSTEGLQVSRRYEVISLISDLQVLH